jgi:putative hydrolase
MGNMLEEFKKIIKSRSYIFHIHTNYTDGINNVNDYFEYASKNNINVIIFTEHVRRNIKYNFDTFINDIKDKNRRFSKIKTLIGCEAKLLPGGDLDIPINILSKIDLICFACHSFPHDLDLYKLSLKRLFTNNNWKNLLRVWVHPGRFLKRLNILENNISTLNELVNIAVSEGIFIEKNIKEDLPPEDIIEKISSDNTICGYDAHSIEELENIRRTLNK